MVTKRHVLNVMTGAACIMGSSLQARESWVSAMMKEMDRHEQEMQHFFDEMWQVRDFDKDSIDAEPALGIAMSQEADALKVTISPVDADAIEAAKNKENSALTITDKQKTLLIELALEHKNFLSIRAQQNKVVEHEEKQEVQKEATNEKEPKAKTAKPVKTSRRSAYSTAYGQWLPEKVDLGAATIEFTTKDKTLTVRIPKTNNASEPVPVVVK